MPRHLQKNNHSFLATELVVLFFVFPLVFALWPGRLPAIPALWMLLVYCLWQLVRDRSFNWRSVWSVRALKPAMRRVLILFGVNAVLLTLVTWLYDPAQLFVIVRKSPSLWASIMIVYPVMSVVPQGIIYRVFFCERYRTLFANTPTLILMSALCFAFTHVIYHNPLVVVLAFIGGLLFSERYVMNESMVVSSFEHALYGDFIFTIGLGIYFLSIAVPFH